MTDDELDGLAAEKICGKMAERYGVNARALLDTLIATVFRVKQGESQFTIHEVAAGLSICETYQLNPLLKEIYITRNPKSGLLLVVLPIDGWVKLIKRDPDFDGIDLKDGPMDNDGKLASMTAFVKMKNISIPLVVTEYMRECFVPTSPVWKQWPNRMLRHKVIIQAGRVACGISGVMDEDDANRITDPMAMSDVQEVKQEVKQAPAQEKPKYLAEPNGLDRVRPAQPEPQKIQGKTVGKGRMKAAPPPPQQEPERQPGEDEFEGAEYAPVPEPEVIPDTKQLWARWSAIRNKLTEEQTASAKAQGPAPFVNPSLAPDVLYRIVLAGEEMVQ